MIFGIGVVVFTISGYLPGEYCLRVFPLICKATESCRMSLSLLGGDDAIPRQTTGTKYDIEFDGPIYGIYSFWRDFQRIPTRGHSVYALCLCEGDLQTTKRKFYAVERLKFNCSPSFMADLGFDCFPKLTQVECDFGSCGYTDQDLKHFLKDGLWKLSSLTSLTLDPLEISDEVAMSIGESGPPAFAAHLRTLQYQGDSPFLDLLSPHCRNLHNFAGYHPAIMAENPNLTSLTLDTTLSSPPSSNGAVDLSQLTSLTKFSVRGSHPFFSKGTHPSLHSVELEGPIHLDSAIEFLNHLSTTTTTPLQHVSLRDISWQSKILTRVPSLKKCKKLTLDPLDRKPHPSFQHVSRWMKGFPINDELWLRVDPSNKGWDKILEKLPQIKDWQVLDCWTVDSLLSNPAPFFTSFTALSSLTLNSGLVWNQNLMNTLITSSPMLKELSLKSYFNGFCKLHSSILRKFALTLQRRGANSDCSGFGFNLPNLAHLILEFVGQEGLFLQQLLDGDPLIHLPQLRVLVINRHASEPCGQVIACKSGHPALTLLAIKLMGDFSSINLQNLPRLRSVQLLALPLNIPIMLDVPGSCDLNLTYDPSPSAVSFSREDGSIEYARQGCSTSTNFTARLTCTTKEWVEMGDPIPTVTPRNRKGKRKSIL